MKEHGMKIASLMLALIAMWFITPAVADAQVTVYHVLVRESPVSGTGKTVEYCDTGSSCAQKIWSLGSGVAMTAGQTLVLTQTGLIPGVGGNFDTSDRVDSSGTAECSVASPCTVKIFLDTTGGGLPLIANFTDSIGDTLDQNNHDPGGAPPEFQPYYGFPVVNAPNYTLNLGYADDVHQSVCPGGCFPNPFDGTQGTSAANFFIGGGNFPNGVCSTNCYDAGVLLITAKAVTNACVAPVFNLGQAGAYTVLGLNAANVIFGSGDTKITGDVGIGPNDTGTLEKATVIGKLFLHSTAHPDIHGDLTVTGGIQTGSSVDLNLQSAVAAALAANAALAALPADQVFGDITNTKTITLSKPGLNVVSLNSVNTVSGVITINGNASQLVVFQVAGQFNCNGCSIHLTGGIAPQNVLWNFRGTGGDVDISKPVGATVGIFLAPDRNILLDKASNIGALIGAENGLKLLVHSGATLTNPCLP